METFSDALRNYEKTLMNMGSKIKNLKNSGLYQRPFLDNEWIPYKIEGMITFLIEMLELCLHIHYNLSHMIKLSW